MFEEEGSFWIMKGTVRLKFQEVFKNVGFKGLNIISF